MGEFQVIWVELGDEPLHILRVSKLVEVTVDESEWELEIAQLVLWWCGLTIVVQVGLIILEV